MLLTISSPNSSLLYNDDTLMLTLLFKSLIQSDVYHMDSPLISVDLSLPSLLVMLLPGLLEFGHECLVLLQVFIPEGEELVAGGD